MYRCISITLPEETVRLIDRLSQESNRSHLIDEAVKRYVTDARRENPRERLK